MFRNIIISLFVLALSGSSNLYAQDNSYTSDVFDNFASLTWNVNITMADNFVGETSWAGGNFEYRKMLPDKRVSLGIDFGWNSYTEHKPTQTYHLDDNTDVTTDLYKYNYTVPMALRVDYYFDTGEGMFQPYLGIGLGAMYSNPMLYFNIYALEDETWGFLARPEVGTLIKFKSADDIGILLAANYSYATNKQSSFKIDNIQSLGLKLGIAWLY